jgi:hypothetical protein
LREAMRWIGNYCVGRQRFWAEIFFVLVLGPLPAVLLPAINDERSFMPGVILFPQRDRPDDCFMPPAALVLNEKSIVGDQPRLIMNMLDSGSEILFRTPHRILSAPYHTNVDGNLLSFAFFRAETPTEARRALEASGADLIFMCGTVPSVYGQEEKGNVEVTADGIMPAGSLTFAQQLAVGDVPPWLEQIKYPLMGGYKLFRFKPLP